MNNDLKRLENLIFEADTRMCPGYATNKGQTNVFLLCLTKILTEIIQEQTVLSWRKTNQIISLFLEGTKILTAM